MEDQIRELLASGVPAVEAAAIAGVTLEKIQTLLKDQVFFNSVKERGKALQTARIEQRYLNTEETLLKKIEDRAKDEMTELPQMVRALEVVAKNRVAYRAPASSLTGPQINVVQLILPKSVEGMDVMMNSNSEIIDVGGRSMASMPLSGVQAIFKKLDKAQLENEKQQKKGQIYEHSANNVNEAAAAPSHDPVATVATA